MFRNVFASLILFIAFLLIACNKKETTVKPDPKTLLTAHAWKIKVLLYRMKGGIDNSNFTDYVYEDCELDDTYSFGTDSTFIRDDNVITCSIPFYFGPYGEGNWRSTMI